MHFDDIRNVNVVIGWKLSFTMCLKIFQYTVELVLTKVDNRKQSIANHLLKDGCVVDGIVH